MYQTLGLIEVSHTRATAYPTEQRRIGSHSLLEWVVRRTSEAQQLDQVLIVTDKAEHADRLRSIAPTCAPVLHFPQRDALSRAVAVVDEYNVRSLVRIRMENPLVDPVLIDQIITSARTTSNCDYATFATSGTGIIASHVGVFADWFRGVAIREADEKAKTPEERHDIATYITHHPETFALRFLAAPPELDREDVRLTMNTADDWEHFHAIYDALGPDALDWHRVSGLLKSHPEMRQRMAELNALQTEAP